MSSIAARRVHLDMLCGLCALAVVIGHIRGFLLVDYSDLASPHPAYKVLYFLTGLGHQAVIAFFALSGYLVGGKVLTEVLAGTWSWPRYIAARLSRLWTVALPALALTLIWDSVGWWLSGASGYVGAFHGLLASGPTPAQPASWSLQSLVGNAVFLQTIAVPPYGSNGPLWSLANEFWYYAAFPPLAVAVLSHRPVWQRLASATTAVFVVFVLPLDLVLLGLIWIAGAMAHRAGHVQQLHGVLAHPFYLFAVVSIVAIAVAFGRLTPPVPGQVLTDIITGIAIAALLPSLANLPPAGRSFARWAIGLSDISYTLYATHFPLLFTIWLGAFAPKQMQPDLVALLSGTAVLALTLGYAGIVWWCFERNTAWVRSALHRHFGIA